jgi:hypothetical protein
VVPRKRKVVATPLLLLNNVSELGCKGSQHFKSHTPILRAFVVIGPLELC